MALRKIQIQHLGESACERIKSNSNEPAKAGMADFFKSNKLPWTVAGVLFLMYLSK